MQRTSTLNGSDGRDHWDWTALSARCLRETRKVLGSEHDAEEAAQEALLRAWRGRAAQRQPGGETWWVTRIARNEALRLAQRARSRDVYTHGSTEALDGVPAGQDTSLLAEILDLREAIAELAPRDALLLRLRYEQDLTQPRVAHLAGMPEGTVKIRLHRIRGRLRERLSGNS